MFKLPTKTELYNLILKQRCEILRKPEEFCREELKDDGIRELIEKTYYVCDLSEKFFKALVKDNVNLCNLQIALEKDYYKITYYEVPEDQLEAYPDYAEHTYSITIKCKGIISFDERHYPEFHKLTHLTF